MGQSTSSPSRTITATSTLDSKFHRWNAVNIGPKKDLIGKWAEAARARGLRYGVTVHAGRSWTWYEVAHGADKQGPVP